MPRRDNNTRNRRTGIAYGTAILATIVLLGATLVRGTAYVDYTAPVRGTASVSGARADGSILLVISDGDEVVLAALDLHDGTYRNAVSLPERPELVVPTPGGVSVFLAYPGRSYLDVFDTRTLEHQTRLEPGLVPPESLSFSPDGDRLYAISDDGTHLQTFAHQRLTLELVSDHTIPAGEGPILVNRRATRLVRPTRDGLALLFPAGGEQVDHVEVPARNWRYGPERDVLWGVHTGGYPVEVTERTGVVNPHGEISVTDHPPVSVGEDVWFIGDGSEYLVSARGTTVDLPTPVTFLTAGADDLMLAVSPTGPAFMIRSGQVVSTREIPFLVSDGAVVESVVSAIVQEGGGFACF